MNKKNAIIRASGFYLTDALPNDFDSMDEHEVMSYIQRNRWEPFDQWEPSEIMELIEDLANEMLVIHRLAKRQS